MSPSQGSPKHTREENGVDVGRTGAAVNHSEQQRGSVGGLQWNAVSKFSRIAAQRKAGVASLETGSLPQGSRVDGMQNVAVGTSMTGNGVQQYRQVNPQALEGGQVEQGDVILMPQQAQLSELQRQVNNYKRQLMFKQHEVCC